MLEKKSKMRFQWNTVPGQVSWVGQETHVSFSILCGRDYFFLNIYAHFVFCKFWVTCWGGGVSEWLCTTLLLAKVNLPTLLQKIC